MIVAPSAKYMYLFMYHNPLHMFFFKKEQAPNFITKQETPKETPLDEKHWGLKGRAQAKSRNHKWRTKTHG